MPYDHSQLGDMSKEELKALQKDVEKALKSYDDRKKAEARAAAEAELKKFGMSLKDITGDAATPGKSKGAPKYQNPNDPSQTWTGRGRKPAWVVEHLDNGGSQSDLAI